MKVIEPKAFISAGKGKHTEVFLYLTEINTEYHLSKMHGPAKP